MMRYSIDLSALTRSICAFVSAPLFVCGGPPLTHRVTGAGFFSHGHGPSCGPRHDLPGSAAAGAAGAGGAGGAVRALGVGATKAPELNE